MARPRQTWVVVLWGCLQFPCGEEGTQKFPHVPKVSVDQGWGAKKHPQSQGGSLGQAWWRIWQIPRRDTEPAGMRPSQPGSPKSFSELSPSHTGCQLQWWTPAVTRDRRIGWSAVDGRGVSGHQKVLGLFPALLGGHCGLPSFWGRDEWWGGNPRDRTCLNSSFTWRIADRAKLSSLPPPAPRPQWVRNHEADLRRGGDFCALLSYS